MDDVRLTSALLWRATGIALLIDAPLLAIVARTVSADLFRALKWHLAGAAFLVYAGLWGVFGSVYFWEPVYSAVFPSWSRWFLPPWFGLLYGAAALLFWRISMAAARGRVVWFVVLGGQMVKPFEDAVATMKVGDVSGVVQTQFGFHVIKLTDARPARTVPLTEVNKKIGDYLLNRPRQEKASAFVQSLKAKCKADCSKRWRACWRVANAPPSSPSCGPAGRRHSASARRCSSWRTGAPSARSHRPPPQTRPPPATVSLVIHDTLALPCPLWANQ